MLCDPKRPSSTNNNRNYCNVGAGCFVCSGPRRQQYLGHFDNPLLEHRRRLTICSTVRRWIPLETLSSALPSTEPPYAVRSPRGSRCCTCSFEANLTASKDKAFFRPDGATERAMPFNTWVKWNSITTQAKNGLSQNSPCRATLARSPTVALSSLRHQKRRQTHA